MPNESQSRLSSIGPQVDELVNQFIRQELQDSAVTESDDLLQKSTTLPKHPTQPNYMNAHR